MPPWGENQKALDYFNQALPLRRAAGDRVGEGKTLGNVGSVYRTLGENQKALDYYNQALPLWRAAGDRGGEGQTLNNIGWIYESLGANQKALDYFNQALVLLRALGERTGESATLNGIGMLYLSLGANQKALDYFNQALAALARSWRPRRGRRDAQQYWLRLRVAGRTNQKALDYYNQALPLRRAAGDRVGEGTILGNIGWVYASLGENQRALDYHNQALEPCRRWGTAPGKARRSLALAGLCLARAEAEGARLLQPGPAAFPGGGGPLKEAATLASIAMVELEQGNLAEALTQTQGGHQDLESLRTKVLSEELRAYYFSAVQSYYTLYIDVLMRLHQLHPDDEK